MRTLPLAALFLGLTGLACTGLVPADTGSLDTGATGDTDEGPEEGVHQTTSCADYLACLEKADPAE
jgi:hypothetical protein